MEDKKYIRKLIREEIDRMLKYPSKKDIVSMLRNNLTSRVDYPILNAFIIGSEAKGTAKDDSDLDIGIIIPKSDKISSLKRTEHYHSKFTSDVFKPKWNGRIVDFQFFYKDDPELEKYSKIKIFEESNIIGDNNIFYHGTTDAVLDNIMTKGLKNPYLTDLYEKAEYYSIEASEDEELNKFKGGSPIVLKIKIPNNNLLMVDFNELDEPVVVDGMGNREMVWKNIKKLYNLYAKNNPKRYDKKYNVVSINPKDYWFSLKTVHSVKYNGIIPPKYIEVI